MKRTILILLSVCMLLLVSCGGTTKSEAAIMVDELIMDIGTVSLNSITQIEKAERYYEGLTETQKDEVENYLVLMEARDIYNELLEASKVIVELTPENFEQYFLINVYCTDFVQGSSHPLGGYNSSSVNVHVDISPLNSDYSYENISVTLKLWHGFTGTFEPSFKIDNPTIAIDSSGNATFVGIAETGDADISKASMPDMELHSIVEVNGNVTYYSTEVRN